MASKHPMESFTPLPTPRVTPPMEELRGQYEQIDRLYELTDALVASVEDAPLKEKAAQMEIVGELIDSAESCATELADSFMALFEQSEHKDHAPDHLLQGKVEHGLRKLYTSIRNARQRAARLGEHLSAATRSKTESLLDALRVCAGRVVAVFVRYVRLSLDRIMDKAEQDDLIRREADLAFTLHGMRLGKA